MIHRLSVWFSGADDADEDDRGRMGLRCRAVPLLPVAAGGQRTGRPQIPGGAALFHGQQRVVAGFADGVRQVEQRLEAVFALEPKRRVRGIFPGAG